MKGLDEPIEICEAGRESLSPLSAPPDSEKARRSISEAQEETLGWRPAVGLHVPGRANWVLEQPLGEGGFGEVWLAGHEKTHARRVFKFCFESERIRGLRREVVLFRLLRESLGARPDIAQILDWEFDSAPYFIESEYTEGGDLQAWAEGQGGLAAVTLETRLELIAQTADALGAAHSVGVLHKDIKPGNILVTAVNPARPQACLTDFGIGLITDRGALAGKNITAAGLTETLVSSSTPSSGGGTRMYMAPELIEGKAASTLSDIYALGVVLYQVVGGDFSHSLAPGWERDISDDLLREDIAACVDGDPQRRLSSAAELAKRLRTLDERQHAREKQLRLAIDAEKAHRRRQQFIVVSIIGVLITAAVTVAALREAGLRRQESSAKQEALLAGARAEQSRDEAMKARDEAMNARAESDRLRHEAEHRLYVSDIQSAYLAVAQANTAQARDTLSRIDEESRGWEWGNLALQAWPNVNLAAAPATTKTGTAAQRWRGANAPLFRYLTFNSTGVHTLDFSPDGTLLAVRAYDGLVCVSRWQTGEILWKKSTRMAGGSRIRFGHQGDWVVFPENLDIVVCDTTTGKELSRFKGHTEVVGLLCVSNDDKIVVSGSLDHTLRAWDVQSGHERWELPLNAYIERVAPHSTQVAMLPDSTRFIFSDEEDRFHIADLATGKTLEDLPWQLPPGYIPVGLSPHADKLLIFSPEFFLVRVLDMTTGKVREDAKLNSGPSISNRNAVFSADGTLAFLRGKEGGVGIFDLEQPRSADDPANVIVRGLSSYETMDALALTPDASFMAAPQLDGTVFIYASSRENRTATAVMKQPGPAYVARFDPVHNQLVSIDLNGGMIAWDLARRTLVHQWKGHADGITELEASSDYSTWLTGSYDGHYAFWKNDSAEPVATIESGIPKSLAGGARGPLVRIAASMLRPHHFSPDGRRVVLATPDNGAQVYDAATREPIFKLTGHGSWVYRCYFSSTGRYIMTHGYQESFVKIWDAETGKERFTLTAPAQIVDTDFSPDDSTLVAATLSATIMRWDLSDGKALPALTTAASTTLSAYFSADGTKLATGETNGTAFLWNAKDGAKLAEFSGHNTNVLSARFNPAGDRVLTSGYDKTLRVWDLSGKELARFDIAEDIHYADWSPDGNQIVVTTVQGSIRLFDSVPWAELSKLGDAETSIEDRLKAWRERQAPAN